MSNNAEAQQPVIKDRLGGQYSEPIRLARESMRKTNNPLIKLSRTYLGQIVVAVLTYVLLQKLLVPAVGSLIMGPIVQSGVVPPTASTAVQAYSEIILMAGFLLFMRFAEGRNFAAMGFIRKNVLRDLLLGYLADAMLFFVATGLTVLITGGSIEWVGTITPGILLFAFLGFFIQGSAEEVNGRSYVFLSTSRKHPEWLGALTSGVIFGLIHLTNQGITPLAVTNIVLVGIAFCLAVLLFENVWCVCAVHAAWNFTQGNILGLAVSGMEPGPSVLKTVFTTENELLSGGVFGIEANIITTMVYLVVIAVLVVLLLKKKAAKEAAA